MNRAGRWRFLYEHRGTRTYWVRHIGTVSVANHGTDTRYNPSGRPWHLINWGATFNTPEEAIDYAIKSYFKPATPNNDRTYERMEALMCGPGRFEQP